MNRYQKEIRRIIFSLAPTADVSAFRWYDYDYLRQIIATYLTAKARNQEPSDKERRFITSIDAQDEYDSASLDPNWSQTEELLRLLQQSEESLQAITVFEQHFDQYRKFTERTQAIGQQMNPSELKHVSFSTHPEWSRISTIDFNNLLVGYAMQNHLSAQDVALVFGQQLTDAYWPLTEGFAPKQQVMVFFRYLEAEGYWLLNLVDLLTITADPNIRALVLLWLRWLKHEKAFHGMEVQSGAQEEIRHVKKMITLLKQDRIIQARPVMIRRIAELWD